MVDANTSPSTFSETTASATPTSRVTQTTSSDLTTSDSSITLTPIPSETTLQTTLDTITDESSQTSTTTSTTSDISTTDTTTSESTSTSSSLSSVLSSASSASDSLTSENTAAQSTSSSTSTTSSSSITSQTIATTNSLTSTTSTTKTTTLSTKCISIVTPTPTCEYGCGKWCSKPIPIFSDHAACKVAVAECILQIADCFLSAGWPASLQCAKYQSWCQSISTYCGSICPGGKCSKKDCIPRNPPLGGPTTTTTTSSTTINACPATSTTASSTSSSTAPIPTVSSICVLPDGPSGSGYHNGKCVGGIQPPPSHATISVRTSPNCRLSSKPARNPRNAPATLAIPWSKRAGMRVEPNITAASAPTRPVARDKRSLVIEIATIARGVNAPTSTTIAWRSIGEQALGTDVRTSDKVGVRSTRRGQG
ncbi:MAG: hypothetical protein LQ339_005111 [Xanthoria mediterranea]|nr:MAG: hypothetical protein LQ339_005111 [Xanthoria mediterranea]